MFSLEHPAEDVTVLRIDDGKVNAIGPPFVQGFVEIWPQATAGHGALVLAGNDRVFSAGLDLQTLPGLDGQALSSFFEGFARMLAELYGHPRPVVTAIEGPALAGGAFLALAGDLRVTGPGAAIGFTEVKAGIPFPPALVDLAKAHLPADEHGPALLAARVRRDRGCVEHGWAHVFVEDGRVETTAVQRARELVQHDLPTFARTKDELRGRFVDQLEASIGKPLEAYTAGLLQEDRLERALERATSDR